LNTSNFQTSKANIKLEPSWVVSTDGVGSELLVIAVCVVMEVLLRVSMIMLANPTKVVMMIAIENKPPVTVLY
jgi:hypothetical protein